MGGGIFSMFIMDRIFEKLSIILSGIALLFILWVGISWVDVISDNLDPNPQHSEYNFFVLFTSLWEDETY